MGSKRNKISILLVALSDIIIINLGFLTAFGLRFGFPLPEVNFIPYFGLIPWLSGTALVIFYMYDLYANWQRRGVYNLLYSVALSILTFTLGTMVLTFWYRGFAFPRSVIITAPIIQFLLLSINRYLIWLNDKRRFGRKRVLIVGASKQDGLALAEKFLAHAEGWFVVEDFLTANQLADLEPRVNNVDLVLVSPNLSNKLEIMSYCARVGKEVLVVPEAQELFYLGAEPQQVDDMLVLSIQPPRLTPSQLMVKRVVDLLVSITLLVLFSPVLLVLYILIPLTSPGPALFKQERLGKDGEPYNILKFRSMVKDAEQKTGPVLATKKDPRITPLGGFIRATRLDELPQLINVLKGDMSLVGPRPERPFFIQKFQANVPHYALRMCVKPGLTGLAQVTGKYSTDVEDKLRFDLMYVRNYSLALDIRILLQTIRVVLQREQAAGVRVGDVFSEEKLVHLFGNNEGRFTSNR